MRMLLTNNDGIGAAGMSALYPVVEGLGECYVVGLVEVPSAVSHAVTFDRELIATGVSM